MKTFTPFPPGNFDPNSLVGKGLDHNVAALVQRFCAVLAFSKVLGDVDRSPETLKVFVAPEFYFKGQGPHWGSFTFNTMQNILGEMHRSAGVPGQDWVVIPGTIVFYLPDGAPGYTHSDGSGLTPGQSAYANVAPILTTGPLNYVLKHQVSNIDGPPQERAASLVDTFKPLVDNWQFKKSRFVNHGNRTIGLEVCLDHGTGELRQIVQNYPQNENKAAPPLDLHVITACGMTIRGANVCSRDNGYVLLCDGLENGADTGSEMRKMVGGALQPPIKPISTQAVPPAFSVGRGEKVVIYRSVPLP